MRTEHMEKLMEVIERASQELCEWKSKHTKINGRMLLDLIHTLQISYGIKFKFCNKKDTGRVLVELLKGEQI